MQQTEVPYRNGFDYGIGVEVAHADPRARGVIGEVTAVEGASGGGGSFKLQRVESTEELETHLGISAEASGGVGLFSASARFDFARDCKVRATSLVLLVTATEQFGFEQIDEPRLAPDAGDLVDDSTLFAERYGDSFVRGIEKGGQFFGVLRIDTRSEESRQQVNTELQGSYGAFSADVNATLSSVARKYNAGIDALAYWEGGRVTVEIRSPEDLIAAADQWRDSVLNLPKPYRVTLSPYAIASGPEPANAAQLEHQRVVLIRCARMRSAAIDSLNLLDYMCDSDHAGEFESVAGLDLAGLRGGVARDLDVIAAAASFALRHPQDACEPETFARTKMTPVDSNYQATILPANLPRQIGGQPIELVTVPDLTGWSWWDIAGGEDQPNVWVRENFDLDVAYGVVGDAQQGAYQTVYAQNPSPQSSVQKGSRLTLTVYTE
jgi:hypothetical protein